MFRRYRLACFALLLFGCVLAGTARAQLTSGPPASDGNTIASIYAPVKLDTRRLFDVLGGNGLTAGERADKIHRRLVSLIVRPQPVPYFTPDDLSERNNETTVLLGGEPIATVTEADAQDALTTRRDLALRWGEKMSSAVSDARTARSNPLTGAGILIRNSFSDLFVSVLRWIPHLAGSLVLTVLFWFFARFNRWIARSITSRTHFDSNLRQLFRALAFYGTWTVGMVAILSTLGLESGSIATTLGISGFVLGFAFKDILSHFFAGLMLLLGRQFHIGDQIVVKEFEGTVERIELRALYLRTYDNRLVIIPNGDVFTSIVTSNTASPHRRRDFVVGIGYEADIEHASAIALATVRGVAGVAQEPAPDVLIDDLAASTVNLRIRFFTNSQRADYLKVGSTCMHQVKMAFEREHISMPTDIHTIVIQNPEELRKLIAPPDSWSEKSMDHSEDDSNPTLPLADSPGVVDVSAAQARSEIQEYLHFSEQRRRLFPRAALVGFLAGLVALAFRVLLEAGDALRNALLIWAHDYPGIGWLFPMLFGAVGAFCSVLLVRRVAPEASGSGIPHLEAVLHRLRELDWKRVLPVKFIGGAFAIGSGLALGREGPTVQMGGTVGAAVSEWLHVGSRDRLVLITAVVAPQAVGGIAALRHGCEAAE